MLPLKPGSTGGNIRITLEQPPGELGYKTGDSVMLTIILEQKEGALWLPPQAVRDFDGRRFVIVQDPGGQRRVDVIVGIESDERVEILEGLNEGDVVIAP
jgi:multidrug efflux pump subunit AcrA (membrane-fusion protein)